MYSASSARGRWSPGTGLFIRILAGIAAGALVLGACSVGGSPSPSASATASPASTPTATASLTQTPIPSPTSTASTPSAGQWVTAGTQTSAWSSFDVVALNDGRALAIGEVGGIQAAKATAELFDPATGTWRATASLPRARVAFAAVTLLDGRVLVTGGQTVNADGADQSFSSSYLYDPRTGHEIWTAVGRLNTARTSPAIALLPDGRVLVAGGYYRDDLAANPTGIVLADVAPEFSYVALASAELFDPATGRWTMTSSMHYARIGARAVTLGDGRILIVGGTTILHPGGQNMIGEIYDPRTGRWTLTDPVAGVDWADLTAAGYPLPADATDLIGCGSVPAYRPDTGMGGAWGLSGLPDGGALLLGSCGVSFTQNGTDEVQGYVIAARYLDPQTGRWTGIGTPYLTYTLPDATVPMYQAPGPVLADGGWVASLAEGRALWAGGYSLLDRGRSLSTAAVFDPATASWSAAVSIPGGARGNVQPVTLTDGSVLLVGFYSSGSRAPTVRFVPGS
jgi:hypothetical protein